MSLSLTLACFWAVIANVIAMTPSKDHHWRNAYMLIAVGIPILGFVTVQHGPELQQISGLFDAALYFGFRHLRHAER